jgi:threonyl-tRNA synthetase
VGDEERKARSVNVRSRDDVNTKSRGEIVTLDAVSKAFLALKESKSVKNKLEE